MNLPQSNFVYVTTIKNDQDIKLEALELFPGLSEISFQSRAFSSYAECVRSCKGFMDDVATDINRTKNCFKVGSEVNPMHTGMKSISQDWTETEVARFWVYDKNMEGGGISAISRTIISVIPKVEPAQVTS